MALGPRPPMPAISVRQAMDAIEAAKSELSPQAFAALQAVTQALGSLAYEVDDGQDRLTLLDGRVTRCAHEQQRRAVHPDRSSVAPA